MNNQAVQNNTPTFSMAVYSQSTWQHKAEIRILSPIRKAFVAQLVRAWV